ncbi:MAG: DUF2339 domain-containing protein [Fuerstiella sp.]
MTSDAEGADQDRLDEIVKRLERIETVLGLTPDPVKPDPVFAPVEVRAAAVSVPEQTEIPAPPVLPSRPAAPVLTPRVPAGSLRHLTPSTTTLMAVGAALSFLLAAAYFIGLVYDSGWLTPGRQLTIAAVFGLVLICGGLLLANRNLQYAAYLPAVGVVILYLTVYAGQMYYHMIPGNVATVLIAVISATAIVVGRRFASSVYTVCAAVGVYLTPLVIRSEEGGLTGLVVYFTFWSLLFSFFSLQERRRSTYLVALYLALLSFDATWRLAGEPQWAMAAIYQCLQFLIFAGTAAVFSAMYRRPMTVADGIAHALPLLYFYLIEYLLLREHARTLVPVTALSSIGVVVVLYILVHRRLPAGTFAVGSALVGSYAALVTAHIVFFELLPVSYLPWAALLLPVGLALLSSRADVVSPLWLPVSLVMAGLFLIGMVLALFAGAFQESDVLMPNAVLLGYAAVLYATWTWLEYAKHLDHFSPAILYAGHLAFMVSTIRFFDNDLLISVTWAGVAVCLLVVALRFRQRVPGQSSLLIFTASALKVLLFDLSGAASLIRIGTLLVLGCSLYIGGWLYQNLVRRTAVHHPDPIINSQIHQVHALARHGMSSAQISQQLVDDNVECRASSGWQPTLVEQILHNFPLT